MIDLRCKVHRLGEALKQLSRSQEAGFSSLRYPAVSACTEAFPSVTARRRIFVSAGEDSKELSKTPTDD